jgi:hypothetical protein
MAKNKINFRDWTDAMLASAAGYTDDPNWPELIAEVDRRKRENVPPDGSIERVNDLLRQGRRRPRRRAR